MTEPNGNNSVALEKLRAVPENVFGEALKGNPHDRAIVRAYPNEALIELSKGSEALGLSTAAAANALELILDAYTNATAAQDALNGHLTAEQQAELIGRRGDLPSHALTVASVDVLHLILLKAVGDSIPEEEPDELPFEAEERTALFTRARSERLYAIAREMKENPAYPEALDLDLGGATFRSHLLFGIWCMGDSPRQVDELTHDLFYDVDLDPGEERPRLCEMLLDYQERRIDPDQLQSPTRSLPPPEPEIADEDSLADGLRQIKDHEEHVRATEEPDVDLG